MTHAYWREGGPGVPQRQRHGRRPTAPSKTPSSPTKPPSTSTSKRPASPSPTPPSSGAARSEIKPSEISPDAYREWCAAEGLDPAAMRGEPHPHRLREPAGLHSPVLRASPEANRGIPPVARHSIGPRTIGPEGPIMLLHLKPASRGPLSRHHLTLDPQHHPASSSARPAASGVLRPSQRLPRQHRPHHPPSARPPPGRPLPRGLTHTAPRPSGPTKAPLPRPSAPPGRLRSVCRATEAVFLLDTPPTPP